MTYTYKCKNCFQNFEIEQSMNDKPLKRCMECGKLSLERIITGGTGVIFKGEGWPGKEIKRKNKD